MSKPTEVVLTSDFLDAIKIKLNDMPQKSLYTKRDAIIYLKEAIDSLIEKHYSVKDISEFLEGEGLSIAPSTLGRFLKEKNKTGKRKPRPLDKEKQRDVQENIKNSEQEATINQDDENGVKEGANADISDAIDIQKQTGKDEEAMPDNGQAELSQSEVNIPPSDGEAKRKSDLTAEATPTAAKRKTNFEIAADTDDL